MPRKIKRILTVEDLIKVCREQKFSHFSSDETGYQLAVKVPTTFEVDENVDDNHRGMLKLKIRIFHTGLNRNKSFVSKESATKAMATIADRPVLAAIHQLDNGEWDFEGHEMEIVTDENGNETVKYIEQQVGSFSSEPAFWETVNGKEFVCAFAYISREYSKACEIIERKAGTKNSCELFIDELSYNTKEKCLELKDFYVNGSTLLGARSDGTEIREGMEGSRADIEDFSVKNNSIRYSTDEKLISILERLENTLSNINTTKINFDKKGGSIMENNESIVTDEPIVNVEGDVTPDVAEPIVDNTDEPVVGEPSTDDVNDTDGTEPIIDGAEPVVDEPTEPSSEPTMNYSINMDGCKREFSVSMNEKVRALDILVNNTYADSDNTYYDVIVYDNHLIMRGYCNKNNYRQNYVEENENFSLSGERIRVYEEYLTETEIAELKNMRENYQELKEFKETAEKNALTEQKNTIANSEKFECITVKDENGKYTNEKFAELMKNIEKYTVEEFEVQLKVIHSDFVSNNSNFEYRESNKTGNGVMLFSTPNSQDTKIVKKRYGDLFD